MSVHCILRDESTNSRGQIRLSQDTEVRLDNSSPSSLGQGTQDFDSFAKDKERRNERHCPVIVLRWLNTCNIREAE